MKEGITRGAHEQDARAVSSPACKSLTCLPVSICAARGGTQTVARSSFRRQPGAGHRISGGARCSGHAAPSWMLATAIRPA